MWGERHSKLNNIQMPRVKPAPHGGGGGGIDNPKHMPQENQKFGQRGASFKKGGAMAMKPIKKKDGGKKTKRNWGQLSAPKVDSTKVGLAF